MTDRLVAAPGVDERVRFRRRHRHGRRTGDDQAPETVAMVRAKAKGRRRRRTGGGRSGFGRKRRRTGRTCGRRPRQRRRRRRRRQEHRLVGDRDPGPGPDDRARHVAVPVFHAAHRGPAEEHRDATRAAAVDAVGVRAVHVPAALGDAGPPARSRHVAHVRATRRRRPDDQVVHEGDGGRGRAGRGRRTVAVPGTGGARRGRRAQDGTGRRERREEAVRRTSARGRFPIVKVVVPVRRNKHARAHGFFFSSSLSTVLRPSRHPRN